MKPLNIKAALAAFGIGAGAMAIAYIFPVGLMLMPALLAFAGTVWGYGGLAIAAITAAGGIIYVAGAVDAGIIGLLVMSIPAGIAMSYIFINKHLRSGAAQRGRPLRLLFTVHGRIRRRGGKDRGTDGHRRG